MMKNWLDRLLNILAGPGGTPTDAAQTPEEAVEIALRVFPRCC